MVLDACTLARVDAPLFTVLISMSFMAETSAGLMMRTLRMKATH